MAGDKWLKLFNLDVSNLEEKIKQMKKQYYSKLIPVYILTGIGTSFLATSNNLNRSIIGGAFLVISMVIMVGFAVMSHNQLCLFKLLKELKKK